MSPPHSPFLWSLNQSFKRLFFFVGFFLIFDALLTRCCQCWNQANQLKTFFLIHHHYWFDWLKLTTGTVYRANLLTIWPSNIIITLINILHSDFFWGWFGLSFFLLILLISWIGLKYCVREREREREREKQRDTKRYKETQKETERYKDTERHRKTQRDTERHRETQRDTGAEKDRYYLVFVVRFHFRLMIRFRH